MTIIIRVPYLVFLETSLLLRDSKGTAQETMTIMFRVPYLVLMKMSLLL